jgi:hypothetical protein
MDPLPAAAVPAVLSDVARKHHRTAPFESRYLRLLNTDIIQVCVACSAHCKTNSSTAVRLQHSKSSSTCSWLNIHLLAPAAVGHWRCGCLVGLPAEGGG